jgi:hypothetical protein
MTTNDRKAWQERTDKGTDVNYVKSVDDATITDGSRGALIDPSARKADTATLTTVLTSGTVPADLVQTQ